ncbi:MAG TPA: hypothetical protein DCY47_06855 [Candidatus Accumulibacter sp.]|nr:hypothetical protein [Accumulibacter sp.]
MSTPALAGVDTATPPGGSLPLLFFALGLSLSGALPIGSLAAEVPGTWCRHHPKVDALASGRLAARR